LTLTRLTGHWLALARLSRHRLTLSGLAWHRLTLAGLTGHGLTLARLTLTGHRLALSQLIQDGFRSSSQCSFRLRDSFRAGDLLGGRFGRIRNEAGAKIGRHRGGLSLALAHWRLTLTHWLTLAHGLPLCGLAHRFALRGLAHGLTLSGLTCFARHGLTHWLAGFAHGDFAGGHWLG